MRVLHFPSTTGGNPQMLARAEREIGLTSWAIAGRQNYLNFRTDEVLLGANESRLKLELKRLPLLWRVWRSFDIVHFNSGQTLMPQRVVSNAERFSPLFLPFYQSYVRLVELRDLPLLKAMGKGIVVTFQGDDARQSDYCAAHFDIHAVHEARPGYYTVAGDDYRRYRIDYMARYADRIYALNPDLLHVLPPQTRFLPYANVDPRELQPVPSASTPDVPVIVHAPTHRGIKGTRFILDAVQRLEADGVPFKFILVEGMSNTEARQLYQQADLLVDQLLIGWYGGLAVELMALGKPVICYVREGDLKFIPAAMRADLPIINATPDTIYTTLKTWLTERKAELAAIGRKSRAFVERWHDPLKIAEELRHEYEAILARQPQSKYA